MVKLKTHEPQDDKNFECLLETFMPLKTNLFTHATECIKIILAKAHIYEPIFKAQNDNAA